MVILDDDAPSAYSQQVGERLRVIRKQKRLSLQEVEAQSTQEFKASVLGAYERGERALSVPRLGRLAQFRHGLFVIELADTPNPIDLLQRLAPGPDQAKQRSANQPG